jgi:hypothetical protein
MKSFESLSNYILSLQSMRDELVTSEVMMGLVELLKMLPTRDFEYSFLAELFMLINQVLLSHKKFTNHCNLELFVTRVSDAL